MDPYNEVTWASEPLSLDKLQLMTQNDQSVADEIEVRPRGILGYSEINAFASNNSKNGYVRDGLFESTFTTTQNTNVVLQDWFRVRDNWNINPNGLSIVVNTEPGRIVHLELYIPMFMHTGPDLTDMNKTEAAWAAQGFKIVRDGADISGESGVDVWTSQGGRSYNIHSFYFDCFDYDPGGGQHIYEVMWKSESGNHMQIWDQMRTTFPNSVLPLQQPDQQYYMGSNGAVYYADANGRYNLSDFSPPATNAVKYVSAAGTAGPTNAAGDFTGEPNISISNFWGATNTTDAYFAGAIPTAQFTATDCGSIRSIVYYKEDGNLIADGVNDDPTA